MSLYPSWVFCNEKKAHLFLHSQGDKLDSRKQGEKNKKRKEKRSTLFLAATSVSLPKSIFQTQFQPVQHYESGCKTGLYN